MLQHSDTQIFLKTAMRDLENCIAVQEKNDSGSDSISLIKVNSNGQRNGKKDIFVCTFCQVFSPHLLTVTEHISSVHFEKLPAGTIPENFVSKLQPLEGNSQKKTSKVGRPRKVLKESLTSVEHEQSVIEPVPDSNGLFWCKVCLRNFRKPRQLLQHICQDPEDEISSDESSFEIDEDVEFKTHMDLDPTPWSRRTQSRSLKENADDLNTKESSVSEMTQGATENKVVPNWRCDPSYVHLFDDEEEKAAFEEHLRAIDYSYVDHLFKVEEKRCRSKSKSNCVYVQSVVYSCKYCNKIFKSLSCVRLHCLIHTDYKPFTCPKCSYKSNSKGSLYMHMRMHTGNVFCCSFCDFKCIKRSHLLDHEATHTSVSQICKLCKNSYKTVRSLVAHIRKYHNNAGGKKYAKSLTCKQTKEFRCDICNKKFKSLVILNNHKHACHETNPVPDRTLETVNDLSECNAEKLNAIEIMQVSNSNGVEISSDLLHDGIQTKDPLAEIVLNNFLQGQQSEAIIYQNPFDHTSENILTPSNNLSSTFQAENMANGLSAKTSILEECQKTLNLDILNECLKNSRFSDECQELIDNISMKHSLQNNSIDNSDRTAHLNGISDDNSEETKSVEIKLFEKCQRAPAYVCCVCSSIYIYPSTLKAHLREHVNSSNSSFIVPPEEQFEPTKIAETSTALDVCQILQDSPESCSFNADAELEKLFTSSLDMMYYLPKVSVVLENDPALWDSMLDDISNFPMNDNSSQDLHEKDDEDSMLECFSEVI